MDLEKINEYNMAKQNIVPGNQVSNISDVATNHIGLHSARIMTPYTTLCSRLINYSPNSLTSELYETRELIKLRCMRKTLHIVTYEMAEIVHMATLKLRISEIVNYFSRNNLQFEFISDLQHVLQEFITVPQKSKDIENQLQNYLNSEIENKTIVARKILKYFWEIGYLCYINVANNWEKEERRYALTEKYYPKLNLNSHSVESAQNLLVYQYIKKFGPVTIKDFTWWSGLSETIFKRYVKNNQDSIKVLNIQGINSDFYILSDEYENLISYQNLDYDWVDLLAYEDPSLKGYYETRGKYVEKKHYNRLFNSIGEVRASIIHNGKAIGVWTWDKKNKCINTEYFEVVDKSIIKKVNLTKEKYEYFLYPN